MWIRTDGEAHAWIEAWDMLYRPGDGQCHRSRIVTASGDWAQVSATFTARGADAPFATTVICAEGDGRAWFTDMAFEAI
jgi:hypothetical protein